MKQQGENNQSSSTIRKRLIVFLEYINESHENFYKKTKLSNSFLRQKKSSINSDNLQKISKAYLELNLEWLITGNGHLTKPFFEHSNIKLSFTGEEQTATLSIEQLLSQYEEYAKCLYLSWIDAQKTIVMQKEKIDYLEKENKKS